MDPQTYQTLVFQNPWIQDPAAFPEMARRYVADPWVPRDMSLQTSMPAHVLIGARQVGKSSLIWHGLIAAGEAPLFINAEEPSVHAWATSPARVARDVAELVHPGQPLVFEEAQRLDDAGLLIKGLVDLRVPHPILVTGSSAFHLQARHRESLAGRASRAVLHPFSLREITRDDRALPPRVRLERTRTAAARAMRYGGYPGVVTSDTPAEQLMRLVEAFIIRDASGLFRIQHIGALRQLMQLVAAQVGDLVNLTEWSALLSISRQTVQHYLDLLADTHILQWVSSFAGGKRAELTSRPKLYFCDNGIRNAVRGGFLPLEQRVDVGALFESWVFTELRKRVSPLGATRLMFWRTRSGAEVDFVLSGPDSLIGLEVKAAALRRPTLTRSARSFIDAYQPKRFIVLNRALEHHEKIAGTDVHWVGPELFESRLELLDGEGGR